ncbi:MAG: XylR family transcriptional regulator [Verrucomicrobiales bacterium]
MAKHNRRSGSRRIALAFQLGAPYQERITHGILGYLQEHDPWEVVSSPEGSSLPLESLGSWDGDGIVAMLETKRQVELAESLSVPVVNLANSLRTPGIATVSSNQRAIGRLAAEHFLERNFRRFGFYGLQGVWYSRERCAGFRDRLGEAGFDCAIHETESSLLADEPWKLNRAPLGDWLRSLSPPTGVFATHDYRARIVLERCADLGLAVPDDIAVIGVDDDPIVCDFSSPPLTSIRQNGREVGYRAASLLDRLMSGAPVSHEDRLVEPEGLVERGSTRVVAVENASLRACLDLVERYHHEPIDVAWLVSKLGISRRRLETLFREELNRTPHEFLSSARIERAKTILDSDRDLPLKEVAAACGFSEPRRLAVVFRRATGMSPREYRESVARP